MRQRQKRGLEFVTAYFVTRCYGGPEEGGWYYNAFEVIETRRCPPSRVEQVRSQLLRRYDDRVDRRTRRDGTVVEVPLDSVQSNGTLDVRIERRPGQYETRGRPHYE